MKKIIPSDQIQFSHSNISTNDVLNPSALHQCRFCKKTDTPDDSPTNFLYPCHCIEPLHSCCIMPEMESAKRGEIIPSKKQKSYTCAKCQDNIRFLYQGTLKCRSCSAIMKYMKKRKCLCASQIVGMILILSLMALLIVLKTAGIQFDSSVIGQTIFIGVIILVIVLALIVGFFFISEILFEQQRKVNLLPARQDKNKRKASRCLEIVDCY